MSGNVFFFNLKCPGVGKIHSVHCGEELSIRYFTGFTDTSFFFNTLLRELSAQLMSK